MLTFKGVKAALGVCSAFLQFTCLYVSVTGFLCLFYLRSVISALNHFALNAHVMPVGAEVPPC